MGQIRVEHLSKIYHQGQENEVRALDDVSFTLEEGEFVVILGPSGAGKSTLLNIMGGMDSPTTGTYEISGRDVSKFKEKELTLFRRKDIGFVFQFYNLINHLTALENVEMSAAISDHPFEAKETMEKVGLGNRLGNFPAQLSGGEQQRTAIARALVKNPEMLLCDEPTGALDSKTGAAIIELLHSLCFDFKKTVVMVTHNAAIGQVATRLIKVADGRIVSNTINEHPLKPSEVVW